ncbi:MAG TPA: hypothetical protein DDZ80_11385 [Cyanobacteria bacterium UBA8803]|nr:hypothetical protein [Cyanobacteria bacterium UBA8803]
MQLDRENDYVTVENAPPTKSENFCLQISHPGLLESLTFRPAARVAPSPGEVEIEVSATGLNFKEVLLALGLIPMPANINLQFGGECAGRIVSLGPGVEGFEIGDEVIAFGYSCFSRFINTSARLVVKKPAHLSFEEAATIPTAFCTAYYALVELGRLQQGEQVLIHAAAGGVGMAAVQIAQWVGTQIFATAGNEEKRAFLRSQGIACVMDSRSLAFADEVMQWTNHQGVDVVLNSLAGEFISKSLEVLGLYGRFLEIGFRDILNNSPLGLKSFEKRISFFAIHLDIEHSQFNGLLQKVVQHFQLRHFSPLPYRVFAITDVVSAFKYMAQAKHIGKIVVSFQNKEELRLNGIAKITLTSPVGLPSPEQPQLIPLVNSSSPEILQLGLLSSEGVDAFSRILSSTFSQVVVSPYDWRTSKLEGISAATLTAPHQFQYPGYVTNLSTSETESVLAQIWYDVIGIKNINHNDNFFEIGGDSLLAAQLIPRIRQRLGVDLSVATLFENPTIASLAQLVNPKAESIELTALTNSPLSLPILSDEARVSISLSPELVTIQPQGNRPPFFCVHPLAGVVFPYFELAEYLGADQPFYGLQSVGINNSSSPLTTIPDMAAHYIKALRGIQPEGPYRLGGWSFGAYVAFEMACQIERAGEKVDILALIDTPSPSTKRLATLLQISKFFAFSVLPYIWPYVIDYFYLLTATENQTTTKNFFQIILEKWSQLAPSSTSSELVPNLSVMRLAQPNVRRLLCTISANLIAGSRYIPQVYGGEVTLFRSSDKLWGENLDDPLGWDALVRGSVDIHHVNGHHLDVLRLPHVKALAQEIKACLK